MAPINLPDGSQVSEIVLPDGSTASEVLAPDGSTVFGAIPDSVDYQWPHSEGNGTTLSEEFAGLTGTINGATWETTSGGQSYLSYNGSGDYTELVTDAETALTHYNNQRTGTFACWVNPDNTNDNYVLYGNTFTNNVAGFAFGTSGSSWNVALSDGGRSAEFLQAGSVSTSGFYPVAFVLDNGSLTVYRDDPLTTTNGGTASSSQTYSSGINSPVRFGAGSAGTSSNFFGDIGPVIGSSQAMSLSDLQQWVDATKDGFA